MAGETPYEAFQSFLEPVRRALSCVNSQAHLWALNSNGYAPGQEHVLIPDKGEPVKLSRPRSLSLISWFEYRLVEAKGDRGPWKVETTAYNHTLEGEAGQEIITYQWHPSGSSNVRFPHLHIEPGIGASLGEVHKYHIPTGRVSFEDVLKFAIKELGAEPQRNDWQEILHATQAAFEEWRRWGGSGPSE